MSTFKIIYTPIVLRKTSAGKIDLLRAKKGNLEQKLKQMTERIREVNKSYETLRTQLEISVKNRDEIIAYNELLREQIAKLGAIENSTSSKQDLAQITHLVTLHANLMKQEKDLFISRASSLQAMDEEMTQLNEYFASDEVASHSEIEETHSQVLASRSNT